MNIYQIGICLAFGSGELLWGVIIKFLPLQLFQCYSFDETPIEDEEQAETMTSILKRSSQLKRASSGTARKKIVEPGEPTATQKR